MPHRGHTTIEMTPRGSPQPQHEGHHNGNHNGNSHHSNERSHTPVHGNGNSHLAPRAAHRRRSPHGSNTNLHPGTPGGSHSGSTNSINHHGTESSPGLSRPRRAIAGNPDLTLDIPHGPDHHNTSADPAGEHAQPLLETDTTKPNIPLAGPELDLSEEDDIPRTAEAHPGVDDGFFNETPKVEGDYPDEKKYSDDENNTDDEKNEDGSTFHGPEYPLLGEDKPHFNGNGGITKTDGDDIDGIGNGFMDPFTPSIGPRSGIDVPFPYAPEFSPGAQPRVIPDVNVYQQKKNLAQGMMDLALLSANANQLRYVLEAADHPYFYPSLIFIISSLILQIGVGVGLIVNSTYNVKEHDDICKADKINNLTVIGIFLITVVNVFIASFGVAQTGSSPVPGKI